jgi:hypothetical protein
MPVMRVEKEEPRGSNLRGVEYGTREPSCKGYVGVYGHVLSSWTLNGVATLEPDGCSECLTPKSPRVMKRGPRGTARRPDLVRWCLWKKTLHSSLQSLIPFR